MKIDEVMRFVDDPNYAIIDTRSPAEYEVDHIPGAINIPLLDNDERKEIGILYKFSGQNKAVERAHEIVNPKLIEMLKKYHSLDAKHLIVYCWRGGMRSRSVTDWLKSKGFSVQQLEGGYKRYREYVRNKLDAFDSTSRFVVLYGKTGCGKTDFLRKTTFPQIDLEKYAQHRSSVFGELGLRQQSQKYFETQLLYWLEKYKDEPYVLVEGESRKIGDIFIPEKLWKAMAQGIHIMIERDVDFRVDIIIKDYGQIKEHDADKLHNIVGSISRFMRKETYIKLMRCIDNGDTRTFVRVLLTDYYDVRYKFHCGKCSLVLSNCSNKEMEDKIKAFLATSD